MTVIDCGVGVEQSIETFGRFSRRELRQLLLDGRDTAAAIETHGGRMMLLWNGAAGPSAGLVQLFAPNGTLSAEFKITSRSRGVTGRVERAVGESGSDLGAFVALLQELVGPSYVAEIVSSGTQIDLDRAGRLVADLLRSIGVSPPAEAK